MKVECLVCGKPTSATHMGMDACRACTVFYKRNYRKRDKLKCGYGKRVCREDTKTFGKSHESTGSNVFNCRKCRIQRFEMVMRSGGIEESSSPPPLLPENNNSHNGDNTISVKSLQIESAINSRFIFPGFYSILYGSYTTQISLDTIDDFFMDCPVPSTVTAAAKALRSCWHESVPYLRKLVKQVNPTDDEFLAIIGLAFWSFECLQTSEQLEELGSRYRAKITTALSDHYRRTIGVERGAVRIGVILCMQQLFKIKEMDMKSDYEIYHILGAFDEETLTYRLQVL
ncbi:hypothetical protein PRIPAC_77026 [Pristionchus pacificus]|uniref:Nuclear receptor n=1 Tax=Pristionchus pacificus TaxID=54126 RepID=A0A2A6CJW2_PRIPA|nr:hypothetical protein PRIPAC_77026 [Pristionchus pacificus]|eukprot:PDM78515.1 nuclear receptor [Pristionchus pacificus]